MDDDDNFPPPPPPYNEADLYEPYEPEPDIDAVIDIPNAYVDLENTDPNQEPAYREHELLKNDQTLNEAHSKLDNAGHCGNDEIPKSSSLDVSSDSDATIDSNEESTLPILEEFRGSNVPFNKGIGYEAEHDLNDQSVIPDCINASGTSSPKCETVINVNDMSDHPSENSNIAFDQNSVRYSTRDCDDGCVNKTVKTKDSDATFIRMEGPEHPLLDKSDSDPKISRQDGYRLVPTSDKTIGSEVTANEMTEAGLKASDQLTDEDARSYSSDYVLLSRIGTGPPAPGTQYTYKNCSLVYKDSMNDVKYVWKEGKVQVKPVDSKKAARKSPAGVKLCVGVTILLTIAVVFLLVSLV